MQVYGDPCENSCMLDIVMLVIIVMLIFKTTLTMAVGQLKIDKLSHIKQQTI